MLEDEKYIYTQNRELSWLKFNHRVLEEASDISVPLLERLKFVEIFTNNLDEFFMVRVGSLKDMTLLSERHIDNKCGMTPEEQLREVFKACVPLYKERDLIYEEAECQLRSCNVCRLKLEELMPRQMDTVRDWFLNDVRPLLSPQLIDTHHPFPHLASKSLNIILYIEVDGTKSFGIIPIPAELPPVLYLEGPGVRFVLLEDVLLHFAGEVFNKVQILDKAVFSITRNADIAPEEEVFDIDEDYRDLMKKVIKKRTRLEAVRLEIQRKGGESANGLVADAEEIAINACEPRKKTDKKKPGQPQKPQLKTGSLGRMTGFLMKQLQLKSEQVFFSEAPLNLKYVYRIQEKLTAESAAVLCYYPYTEKMTSGCLGFDIKRKLIPQVLEHDVLIHYPYESMEPFLQLIKEASQDPEVAAIKITIYRMAAKTKLVEYLCAAAENGKSVTVLMELRARFDEQNNIEWAERLEEAGCTMLYGIDGIKVHSKVCLITRRSKDGQLRYITQIGTGNYNEKTAKLYVDLCLITGDQAIGSDAAELFQNLALANLGVEYKKLLASPFEMRDKISGLIDREIAKGSDGYIFLKMNSLTDRTVIDKLAEASGAGVRIVMNIRGICCLLPGIEDHTENITIFSIVGRYLEHTRIYCFGCGEDANLYISSADFMTRNMERRVEVACPIEDEAARKKIFWIINTYLSDNVKARLMLSDGNYRKLTKDESDRLKVVDKVKEEENTDDADSLGKELVLKDKKYEMRLERNPAAEKKISAQDIFMREQPEFERSMNGKTGENSEKSSVHRVLKGRRTEETDNEKIPEENKPDGFISAILSFFRRR